MEARIEERHYRTWRCYNETGKLVEVVAFEEEVYAVIYPWLRSMAWENQRLRRKFHQRLDQWLNDERPAEAGL